MKEMRDPAREHAFKIRKSGENEKEFYVEAVSDPISDIEDLLPLLSNAHLHQVSKNSNLEIALSISLVPFVINSTSQTHKIIVF